MRAQGWEPFNSGVLETQRSSQPVHHRFRFSMQTFNFVHIKINTLKKKPYSIPSISGSLLSTTMSVPNRPVPFYPLPLTFSLPSLVPFPLSQGLTKPRLAPNSLCGQRSSCLYCWRAAVISLCHHACLYEVLRQNPELWVSRQALHHPQPKLFLESASFCTFVSFSGKVILA